MVNEIFCWTTNDKTICIWNKGLEESEEPDNVEDEDREAAEANDSEEEESEEELDLVILIYVFQIIIIFLFLKGFVLEMVFKNGSF